MCAGLSVSFTTAALKCMLKKFSNADTKNLALGRTSESLFCPQLKVSIARNRGPFEPANYFQRYIVFT